MRMDVLGTPRVADHRPANWTSNGMRGLVDAEQPPLARAEVEWVYWLPDLRVSAGGRAAATWRSVWKKSERGGIRHPVCFSMAAAARRESSECPPNSKKLSSAPIRSTSRISCHTFAISVSAPDDGGVCL